MMTGHCRILTQELSACDESQIPVPMMGTDKSMATKFMAPITLLLKAMFFFGGGGKGFFGWGRDGDEFELLRLWCGALLFNLFA